MRIAYHLGAHFTDEERLLRCMLKNHDLLAQNNIVVPNPDRYRTLLRETAFKLKGETATVNEQALILEAIMEEDRADRLILSWDSFLSLPKHMLNRGLYTQATQRISAICKIFPEIEAEFHLALRNPASLLPALYRFQRQPDYADFINGTNPLDIYWSDVIERILDANPGVPLTVWCDEDTPLIWPEVLRAVSGLPADCQIAGEDDFLASLMSGEGMTRMQAYMDKQPPQTVAQRRKIVSAFLDKFALPERIDLNFEMPGWSPDMVAEITQLYEEDVRRISMMANITFIAP